MEGATLALPEPEDILSGIPAVDPQLVNLVQILHDTEDSFDKVASVGLSARIGASSSADPTATLKALRLGEAAPRARAMTWSRKLPPEAIHALVLLTMEEAAEWVRHAERLVTSKSAGDELVLLAYWRDRIESVTWVLDVVGEGAVAHGLRIICAWPAELGEPVETEETGGLLALVGAAEPWADWVAKEYKDEPVIVLH